MSFFIGYILGCACVGAVWFFWPRVERGIEDARK